MSYPRCYREHGRGSSTICIEDDKAIILENGECNGVLLRESPCEEIIDVFELVGSREFRVKENLAVTFGEKCFFTPKNAVLKGFSVEASTLYIEVKGGARVNAGDVIAYWVSAKRVIRKVRSPYNGLLLLVLWSPLNPNNYTFLIDTDGVVREYCLTKKRSTS